MQEWVKQLVEKFEAENDPYKRVSYFVRLVFRSSEAENTASLRKELLDLMSSQRYETEREKKLNEAWKQYLITLSIFFLPSDAEQSQTFAEQILQQNEKTLALFTELEEEIGQAETLINMALVSWSRGEYKIAFENAFKAASLAQNHSFPETSARIYYNLGNFYFDTKDFENARKYYELGKKLAEENQTEGFILGRSLIGLANLSLSEKDYLSAQKHLLKAIEIQQDYGDKPGISRSLNDLGNISIQLNDFESALKYYQQAILIRRTQPNQQGYITTLLDLAELYLLKNQINTSRRYAKLALRIAQKNDSKPKIARAYRILSKVAELSFQYQEALIYFQQFFELQEKILGKEQAIKLKEIESMFQQQVQIKEAEIEKLKNVELKEAYQKIERKNRDLISSINYAKRIQQAILPNPQEWMQILPQSFVLFLPRDIVSGDFYWLRQVEGKVLVAAIDCTGHGVPGAFMSMIANDLLNTIVLERKITEPSEILNHLKKDIYTVLKQEQTQNRDGMDMSIATFEPAKNRLVVGCANAYFAYFFNDELFQIKGDNIVIGDGLDSNANFSQWQIDPRATLYLYSDGMADQFGGSRDRKLMLKGFRNILFQAAKLPLAEQKSYVENQFYDWMSTNKQIDDVLVMGIRFVD